MNDDFVQPLTMVIAFLGLLVTIVFMSKSRKDWSLLSPVLMLLIHAIVFYFCVIFLPWENFSFSHWSRWLRLHEYSTILLVLIGMFLKHEYTSRFFKRRSNDNF